MLVWSAFEAQKVLFQKSSTQFCIWEAQNATFIKKLCFELLEKTEGKRGMAYGPSGVHK